ncbi:hypothetical protein BJV78DRAFT_1230426, partial [Lactifluus subvellereus]
MDYGIAAVTGQTDHDIRKTISPYPIISLVQHTHTGSHPDHDHQHTSHRGDYDTKHVVSYGQNVRSSEV